MCPGVEKFCYHNHDMPSNLDVPADILYRVGFRSMSLVSSLPPSGKPLPTFFDYPDIFWEASFFLCVGYNS